MRTLPYFAISIGNSESGTREKGSVTIFTRLRLAARGESKMGRVPSAAGTLWAP